MGLLYLVRSRSPSKLILSLQKIACLDENHVLNFIQIDFCKTRFTRQNELGQSVFMVYSRTTLDFLLNDRFDLNLISLISK